MKTALTRRQKANTHKHTGPLTGAPERLLRACVRFFFQQAHAVELNRLMRHYQRFALVVVGGGGGGGGIALAHLPICPCLCGARCERWGFSGSRRFVIVFASFQPRSESYICIYVPRRVSHQLLSESKLESAGWLYSGAKVVFMGLHVLTDASAPIIPFESLIKGFARMPLIERSFLAINIGSEAC
jgi:hypothetical protein